MGAPQYNPATGSPIRPGNDVGLNMIYTVPGAQNMPRVKRPKVPKGYMT